VDLSFPPELSGLQQAAIEFATWGASRREIREDGWIVGFDKEFSRALGHRGWLGMTWPITEGGHGRSVLERFVVTEALIGNGAPIAASYFGDRQVGPMLLAHGTVEQRRRYIPGLVAGADTWCIGMSESDSGSDLASLLTRASLTADGYAINGAKVWTSSAADADYCYLVARTDPEAPPHLGLSEFIVDMNLPGISVDGIRDMTGGTHFYQVRFENVRVGWDSLVGTLGASWTQLMRQLEFERGGIDRLISNRALFDYVLAHIDRPEPEIRRRIGKIAAGYASGRMMVLRELLDRSRKSHSTVTKLYCTRLEQEVASLAVDVFGCAALTDYRLWRSLAYAPAYTIQGGTNNILKNIVGERLLGLPRK
jgi:alkylation response protein AidB-like acyl-CoA dehydrogenase